MTDPFLPWLDDAGSAPPLRPDQDQAITDLRQSLLAGCSRLVLQAPTGYGKTLVAAAIINCALAKGNRVVFIVPAITLVDQALEAFRHAGILDIGVIQADHPDTDWSAPVQVASVQTLMRRGYPKAELVIIDEVHRWFDFYGKWMAEPDWQGVPFIGLSATPWTKGLGKHFQRLVIASTISELIEAGHLANFRVFAPAHPDLSAVKTIRGDYDETELAKVMGEHRLVADVVQTWIERGEGRPTLCFAVDRTHAEALQKRFIQAGIPAGYQDALTSRSDRADIKRRFHDGSLKVVCNVGTLTTGVDWNVGCIIMARPTKSEILFVQIVGRGLRVAPDKEDCLILDHSDNHLRLGFVTDIQHDTLDDGTRRQNRHSGRAPLPRECPKCSFLRPARVRICPVCGYKPEAVSKVETIEGRLAELRPRPGRKEVPAGFVRLQDKVIPERDFYAQLRGYGAEHDYADGWAANLYREKTGAWPNACRYVAPVSPCAEVLSYIRSRQIAFARSRAHEIGRGA